MDFDSYEDLLRSINVAESLESIPPVMFEVLGTVLEQVPERNTARVYRTPRTDGVGVGNPAETLRAVDALNGTRTYFQSDENSAVLVRDEQGPAEEPERDDIDDCATEPGDEIMSDKSETMVDMDEDETGSPTGEVVDDFAEVFQLLTFTGEEDEEMIEGDIFSPGEVMEMQDDDIPTQEDNQANEAGVLDFLESVAEHSKEAPYDNGDVLSPNDFEAEFNGSPFRVIDEYYGGRHRGKGLWGHYFRQSHALACRHFCYRNCWATYHPPGSPVEPCVHPHAKYHLNEEKLIREMVEKKMEPWQRVTSAMYHTMVYKAGDLRDIYDDAEVQKSHEARRAAMERLEIIKNAKGPMLRSQLVAEVCTALLAAGSAKGYTFTKCQMLLSQAVPPRNHLLIE